MAFRFSGLFFLRYLCLAHLRFSLQHALTVRFKTLVWQTWGSYKPLALITLDVAAVGKRNDAPTCIGLRQVGRQGAQTLCFLHHCLGDGHLLLLILRTLLHSLRHLHLFFLLNLFLDQRDRDVGRNDAALNSLLELLQGVLGGVGQNLLCDAHVYAPASARRMASLSMPSPESILPPFFLPRPARLEATNAPPAT